MKSQEELFNMTVMELREYMNSLSNSGNGVAGMGMAAAAALLMFIPNVVLFILMQSRVMSTMSYSGLK